VTPSDRVDTRATELHAADLVRLDDYLLAESDFREGAVTTRRVTFEGSEVDPASGDVLYRFAGAKAHTFLREIEHGWLANAAGLKVRLYGHSGEGA
jgi:hypothetical protein